MNLKDHFPRASQAFLDANPLPSPSEPIKTHSTGIGGGWEGYCDEIINRKKHEANHQRKIQDSEPQYHKTAALDSADARKKEGVDRTKVSFIGFRVRPLDPDNFAGSVKDLLDGLRHASILKGDEWWRITLETRQEKVKSYAEERTVIKIETP